MRDEVTKAKDIQITASCHLGLVTRAKLTSISAFCHFVNLRTQKCALAHRSQVGGFFVSFLCWNENSYLSNGDFLWTMHFMEESEFFSGEGREEVYKD